MSKTLFIIGLSLAIAPFIIVVIIHYLGLITTTNIGPIFVLTMLSILTGFELINVSTKEY